MDSLGTPQTPAAFCCIIMSALANPWKENLLLFFCQTPGRDESLNSLQYIEL